MYLTIKIQNNNLNYVATDNVITMNFGKVIRTGGSDLTKEYVDEQDEKRVEKIEGKGLSTNDYTTEEKEQLSTLTQPTFFTWNNDEYVAVIVPPDFNNDIYQIMACAFLQSNPIDNPKIRIGDKTFTLKINDQFPLAGRISNEEICLIWFVRSEARIFALDPNRATIEETLLGVDKNKYITAETLKVVSDEIKSAILAASNEVYQAAIAYTESRISNYDEPILLYLHRDNTMDTIKPTGGSFILTKNLTTTEQLLVDFKYTITEDGVFSKDSKYDFSALFGSVSGSRDTYIRLDYSTAEGVNIINSTTLLDSDYSTQTLNRTIISRLVADLPYAAGQEVVLNIYGRVSSGNDNITMTFDGIDNLGYLSRAMQI